MYKWQQYTPFYKHPFIQSIAHEERWTFSDKDKRPIDMQNVIKNHYIRGAFETNNTCLVDLSTLVNTLPNVPNHAYYMSTYYDNFIALDIEPNCPEDIKQQFLQLPFIYGEKSLSGKGYHLIFPKPPEFNDYPVATKKLAMKHKNHYEILHHHYITFTRNIINPPINPQGSISDIWVELAKQQTEIKREQIDLENTDVSTIPASTFIIERLLQTKLSKTFEDFNDHSRYTFSVLTRMYYHLMKLLDTKMIQNTKHTYTDSDQTLLLYHAIKQFLPDREKHHTLRDGMPYLLYVTTDLVQREKARRKDKKT